MDDTVKGFQTNEGTKQYDYNALANLPSLISQGDVDNAVVNALAQAKQNGDFDYILTEDDKIEVADIVLTKLPTWNGGSY